MVEMFQQRPECCAHGCSIDLANDRITHAPSCPNHPDKLNVPAPVASLASARFDHATHPEDLSGRDALIAALDWWDSCPVDEKPTHVIVMIGQDTPGKATASGTKFFQAGTYRHHAQMGLCLEAMHLIRESG